MTRRESGTEIKITHSVLVQSLEDEFDSICQKANHREQHGYSGPSMDSTTNLGLCEDDVHDAVEVEPTRLIIS